MTKLSDNRVGDRLHAALEMIGTEESETVRGNTALIAARQSNNECLFDRSRKELGSRQHPDEPAHRPALEDLMALVPDGGKRFRIIKRSFPAHRYFKRSDAPGPGSARRF
jgi:hypothetical protein